MIDESLWEMDVPNSNVETPERSDTEDEKDQIQPSRHPGTEGGTPRKEGLRAPRSIAPHPEAGQPHLESKPFQLLDGASEEQQVQ